jgi:hypothetical protein
MTCRAESNRMAKLGHWQICVLGNQLNEHPHARPTERPTQQALANPKITRCSTTIEPAGKRHRHSIKSEYAPGNPPISGGTEK